MRNVQLVFACIAVLAGRAAAQAPPTINLRLPSSAAGGGTLAVRLTIPPQVVGPRYAEGAPIVVFVAGGHGTGTLNGGQSFALQGFVAVNFLFPGGVEGSFHSDGTFDYRGAQCIAALGDVILFAGGRKTDDLGRGIGQLLPFRALTEMVGLHGSSNGGPMSMAVLGTYGGELGFVTTYVGWENPTNSQTVVVEAGGKGYDCSPTVDGDGNGIPTDDGKNPYLASYGAASLGMEFGRLAYDSTVVWTATDPANLHPPVAHTGVLFLDGNGNGRLDTLLGDPDCYDANDNGRLDAGDDYLFRPLAAYDTGNLLLHYSIEVANEAQARQVFGATWPADVASPAENAGYWALRDATSFYAAVAAARPDLHCLLSFAAEDHVQASDDHLHIQQAYDGLRGGGIWCRLNPDEAYYRLVNSTPARPPADNDANVAVAWPAMGACAEEYPLSSTQGTLAAVMEMADRARGRNWLANLEGPVSDVESGRLAGSHGVRITPNPATAAAAIEWWGIEAGSATLRLYDVAGRRRAALPIVTSGREGRLGLERLLGAGSGLSPGVYWLEFRAAGGRPIRRSLVIRR